MEIAEIKDLLNKMNAFAEDGDSLDSAALMQDPIVLNRLAVELLQQIDRDVKPELVIAPEGIESYFDIRLRLLHGCVSLALRSVKMAYSNSLPVLKLRRTKKRFWCSILIRKKRQMRLCLLLWLREQRLLLCFH